MWACAAPLAPFAIVGYSGVLVAPPGAKPEKLAGEIKSRPPVLLIHGDQDDLIPVDALFHRRAGSPRSASRWSGICRTASATASTRRGCAMAANFCARRLAARRIGLVLR